MILQKCNKDGRWVNLNEEPDIQTQHDDQSPTRVNLRQMELGDINMVTSMKLINSANSLAKSVLESTVSTLFDFFSSHIHLL